MNVSGWKQAVICHANYARFDASLRRVLNPCVQSRMCLWCKSGSGAVIINDQSFTCEHGDYFFLPWNHRVEYVADQAHPFYLAGIHIIPHHDPGLPVEFEVPHVSTHRLHDCTWRKDAALPMLQGIQHRPVGSDAPLYLLSESIVQLFRLSSPKDEVQIRILTQALIRELIRTLGSRETRPSPPPHLRKLLSYVDQNLARAISVADLARRVDRSKSGINCLFRTNCGKTPTQWIIEKRIERARELLSTTNLSIGEIGAAVSITDPFYFSKLFKKVAGQPPKAYRKQNQQF